VATSSVILTGTRSSGDGQTRLGGLG